MELEFPGRFRPLESLKKWIPSVNRHRSKLRLADLAADTQNGFPLPCVLNVLGLAPTRSIAGPFLNKQGAHHLDGGQGIHLLAKWSYNLELNPVPNGPN